MHYDIDGCLLDCHAIDIETEDKMTLLELHEELARDVNNDKFKDEEVWVYVLDKDKYYKITDYGFGVIRVKEE